VAGVTHSRLVVSPSGSGFNPRYEILHRGVKPPRVSAALAICYLRRKADLPQVDRPRCGAGLHRMPWGGRDFKPARLGGGRSGG
jgi:hypothetical protein